MLKKEKEEILISFEQTLPPDYTSFIIKMLFTEFSLASSIEIMENYYFSEDKNEMVYGEDATDQYFKDLKEVIIEIINEILFNEMLQTKSYYVVNSSNSSSSWCPSRIDKLSTFRVLCSV